MDTHNVSKFCSFSEFFCYFSSCINVYDFWMLVSEMWLSYEFNLANHIPFPIFMIYLLLHLCFYREREDVVRTVALGVYYAVKTSWLEDCDREKKQVHVLRRYSAYDILFPKGVLSCLVINLCVLCLLFGYLLGFS